jgi:Protein of unknown function (DUF3298)
MTEKTQGFPENQAEYMKKFLLLIVVYIIFSGSLTSDDKSWFKSFTGNIGGSPVTMHLIKYGESIQGYYYYNKYSIPLNVLGTEKGDSLSLIAYMNSGNTERFRGRVAGESYSGIWELDTTKTEPFMLKDNNAISEKFEYVYGTKKLFDKMETSPVATYTEGCIWPVDDYENSEFLRKQILKAKNFPPGLNSIGSRMLESKNAFMKEYFEQYEKTDTAEAGDMSWSYTMEVQDIMTLAYIDKNIAVLSRFWYSFSGGAHGNYGTGFYCYDLKDQEEIKLEDVLIPGGILKLPELLDKNYRKQNDVDPKQTLSEAGLFMDTIKANDNFMITPGALIFNYVPYEIGPYAAGQIVIYIPIGEIESYLKAEIKKLLKL